MTTLDFAIELAHQAGQLLREAHSRGPSQIKSKLSSADLVTEVDLASEQVILSAIRQRFPDHAIYAEESGGTLPPRGAVWTVDPLDGTTNFAHGLPLFCVSLALIIDGRVQLGVTYDPLRDHLFWAERGRGAWRNDRRLHVSTASELGRSLLESGFAYHRADTPDNNLPEFNYFMPRSRGVRWLGSAALSMAWLAAGQLDGYWENDLKAWDWAAGQVLVEEAGGRVSTFDGQPWRPGDSSLVASNGSTLHAALLDGIATARGQH